MALSTSETALAAATFPAPTGVTAFTFASAGIQNGILKASVQADADLRLRRYFTFKAKEARANAASVGGYTMQRNTIKFVVPKLLASGAISQNYVTIEIGHSAETTLVEKQLLIDLAAHVKLGAFQTGMRDGSYA